MPLEVPMNAQVALLVLTAIWRWGGSDLYEEPRGLGSRQHLYWLSVANKRAYAELHGYSLYVLSHHLEAGRWPTWDKLLAAQAVLKHSKAEWLWMTDADAFIMNLGTPVSRLISEAVQQSQQSRGQAPDIIAAEDCLIPLNSGSMIFHNTPWTRQHLSNVWHADDNCNGYTDNGAFLELWKSPEVQQHYWQVPQRLLNAYPPLPPNGAEPACPSGTYQDGGLLLHFPGDYKSVLEAFLVNRTLPTSQGHGVRVVHLPLYSSSTRIGAATASRTALGNSSSSGDNLSQHHDGVPCYAVYDAHLRGHTDAATTAAKQQLAELIDVTMISVRQQGITTVTKAAAITLSIQPLQDRLHGGTSDKSGNPGWPVALLPGVTDGFARPAGGHVTTAAQVTDLDR